MDTLGFGISSVLFICGTQDIHKTLEQKIDGLDIIDGGSAIVPVILYDAKLSQTMANMLLKEGIYVIGFFFPSVPKEKARIHAQLSAAHTKAHLDKAVIAFTKAGEALNII